MDINQMSRKQFDELPILEDFKKIKVDSIVLLPTRKHHPSGFNYYTVVACYGWEALGKCNMYDTFSIYISDNFGRVGIDCLRKSGLMRLFLPQDNYMLNSSLHNIKREVKNND